MSRRRPPSDQAPLHRQLHAALVELILSGRVKPGETLPSERELCAVHGVSRITAIRALDEVAASGMAERRQGRGTVVTYPRVRRSFDSTMGLTEVARHAGFTTRATVLERTEVDASDLPAALLPAPDGAYLRVHRLRFLGALPAVSSTSWIELGLARGLDARAWTVGSLHEAFAKRTGQAVEGSRVSMAPIVAGRALAAELGVPRGSAHLLFHGTSELADGTVVERTRSVFRGDLFEFSATMRRHPFAPATAQAGAKATTTTTRSEPVRDGDTPIIQGKSPCD